VCSEAGRPDKKATRLAAAGGFRITIKGLDIVGGESIDIAGEIAGAWSESPGTALDFEEA